MSDVQFFFTRMKEELYIMAYGIKFLKCSSTEILHSIELSLGTYIIGHSPTYCVDVGEEYRKEFLCITLYGVKL